MILSATITGIKRRTNLSAGDQLGKKKPGSSLQCLPTLGLRKFKCSLKSTTHTHLSWAWTLLDKVQSLVSDAKRGLMSKSSIDTSQYWVSRLIFWFSARPAVVVNCVNRKISIKNHPLAAMCPRSFPSPLHLQDLPWRRWALRNFCGQSHAPSRWD